MSVDIYGRTYKGAQYRELVEYATRLVPKRSQEKSEHPDPFVGHPARRGKSMILEWLKHRSEHAKERQKRGLPPRRPSRTEWISSASEAEVLKQAKKSALSKDKDSLADDSSTIATEDRPVPQNLLELTFPSWTTIVPHQGDSDEHTGVIEELGLPPVPRLRTKVSVRWIMASSLIRLHIAYSLLHTSQFSSLIKLSPSFCSGSALSRASRVLLSRLQIRGWPGWTCRRF